MNKLNGLNGLSVLDTVASGWLGVACDHCGRKDRVMGSVTTRGADRRRFYLCHAQADGRKADPDCYHLVTTYRERLGARIAAGTH